MRVLTRINKTPKIRKFLFSQGMHELPPAMNMRFWFYIHFLSVLEETMTYLLFLSGTVLLVWSVVRILSYQAKESPTEWLETEMKRRRQRVHRDKQNNPGMREMDTYNSLLVSGDSNFMA